ncbi:MAG: hypothetical protein M1829_001626 [Trizodia sp. TS-e1964]|nr:MAG: hypothetical protein M1829_001626 [Trizodia sp. TS-e1964]
MPRPKRSKVGAIPPAYLNGAVRRNPTREASICPDELSDDSEGLVTTDRRARPSKHNTTWMMSGGLGEGDVKDAHRKNKIPPPPKDENKEPGAPNGSVSSRSKAKGLRAQKRHAKMMSGSVVPAFTLTPPPPKLDDTSTNHQLENEGAGPVDALLGSGLQPVPSGLLEMDSESELGADPTVDADLEERAAAVRLAEIEADNTESIENLERSRNGIKNGKAPQEVESDDEEFNPEDESTPLQRPKAMAPEESGPVSPLAGPLASPNPRKRKMGSPEIQVPATPPVDADSQTSPELPTHNGSHSRTYIPASFDTNSLVNDDKVPEIFSETMAPPESSSSPEPPSSPAGPSNLALTEPYLVSVPNGTSNGRSQRKGKTSQKTPYSVKNSAKPIRNGDRPHNLTSAELCAQLAPRHRNRSKTPGQYDIPDSSDREIDTSALGPEDDELGLLSPKRRNTRKIQPSSPRPRVPRAIRKGAIKSQQLAAKRAQNMPGREKGGKSREKRLAKAAQGGLVSLGNSSEIYIDGNRHKGSKTYAGRHVGFVPARISAESETLAKKEAALAAEDDDSLTPIPEDREPAAKAGGKGKAKGKEREPLAAKQEYFDEVDAHVMLFEDLTPHSSSLNEDAR